MLRFVALVTALTAFIPAASQAGVAQPKKEPATIESVAELGRRFASGQVHDGDSVSLSGYVYMDHQSQQILDLSGRPPAKPDPTLCVQVVAPYFNGTISGDYTIKGKIIVVPNPQFEESLIISVRGRKVQPFCVSNINVFLLVDQMDMRLK